MKRTKWRTGSFDALEASKSVNSSGLSTKSMSLTERPFGRVHKYSEILMGKAMGTVVHVAEMGWFKREWGVELYLTFDREVMEKLQRL